MIVINKRYWHVLFKFEYAQNNARVTIESLRNARHVEHGALQAKHGARTHAWFTYESLPSHSPAHESRTHTRMRRCATQSNATNESLPSHSPAHELRMSYARMSYARMSYARIKHWAYGSWNARNCWYFYRLYYVEWPFSW